METFDIAILGAGPGGYVAAIRAAQLGLSVVLIEKEHLGGICLNWGCIPTKALLRTAEIKRLIDHAQDFGIHVPKSEILLEKVVERSRGISQQLAQGVKGLLKKNRVMVRNGHGRFKGPHTIEITSSTGEKEEIHAKKTIIATGARPRPFPGIEANGDRIWNAKHAMTPVSLPSSLLVIGSGAIGIEFANFYQTLGTHVTVLERENRILPQEDEEISLLAQKIFEKQGITFHLNAQVEKIKSTGHVTWQSKGVSNEMEADRVLIAIGVIGNTEELGLETTDVQAVNGRIEIDAWGQTKDASIFAIGDVAGAPWLAHKASHQGILCVERIAGCAQELPLDLEKIPGCTYTSPQLASVGLTESQARERYGDIRIGRFSPIGNGKALAMGEPQGLIKTIFHKTTGELLGAHMIGPEVTELIQGFVIAKTLEATEADLMHTIFPHPTLSEMMHESVLNAFDRTIHL